MKLYKYLSTFLLLLLFACKTHYAPASHTENLYSIKDSTVSDTISSIETYLKPFRDSLSGIMNEVIGVADGDFVKEKPGGSLGNMVTDAMIGKAEQILGDKKNTYFLLQGKEPRGSKDYKNCFVSISNYGGLRIPEIKKGNITKGKIFELLPFENELVILEMKGVVLSKWCDLIAKSGGWPTAHLYFSIQDEKAKIIHTKNFIPWVNDYAKGYPPNDVYNGFNHSIYDTLNISETYYVATNDYVANGGDNCDFLKDQKRINTGILIRDIVIDYIKSNKTILPDNKKRIELK